MWSTIKGCVFLGRSWMNTFPCPAWRANIDETVPCRARPTANSPITAHWNYTSLSNHFKKRHAWVPWALDGCVHRTQLPGAVFLCVVNSWSVQLKYFEIGQGDVIFGKHRMTFWQPNKNKAPLKLDKIQKQTGTAERKWMCRNECLLWVLFEKSVFCPVPRQKKNLWKN